MIDRELMQQALDVMLAAIKAGDWKVDGACDPDMVLEALRARLAQPEPEPVTMVISKTGDSSVTMSWWHEPALPVGTSLYTAPPQREWQGLTDEEVRRIVQGNTDPWCDTPETDGYGVAEMVEAKLKEKNGF